METLPLDAAFWLTCGAILILLVLSAFFSGSETALTAASRGKLRSAADKGSKGASQALVVTEDNERLIGSVLLGNNVVNILATSLATAVLTKLFGQNGMMLFGKITEGITDSKFFFFIRQNSFNNAFGGMRNF